MGDIQSNVDLATEINSEMLSFIQRPISTFLRSRFNSYENSDFQEANEFSFNLAEDLDLGTFSYDFDL